MVSKKFMATRKQIEAARENIKKAQAARRKGSHKRSDRMND